MKFRRLGRSGLRVSEVGLGCNVFGAMEQKQAQSVIGAAIDAGITLFDTADVYGGRGGSETQIGSILGGRRKDIVLASKFAMPMDDEGAKRGASRKWIMQAVEDSLTRLKTDWLDLYQVHRFDERTPIEETLRALEDLIRQGKVRYIGCSNFPAWRIVEAQWAARAEHLNPFISTQDGYSLLNRRIEADVIPAAEAYGLGVIPYSPLAGGLLSGKYQRDAAPPEGTRLSRPGMAARVMNERNLDLVDQLKAWAEARGHTVLELAIAWLLSRPAVSSVIAGATRPEQVEANVAASEWVLTEAERAEADAIAA